MVELAVQLRLQFSDVPCLLDARNNSAAKADWRPEDREYAERKLLKSDRELYNCASELSTARLLRTWGSTQELAAAVSRYTSECSLTARTRMVNVTSW